MRGVKYLILFFLGLSMRLNGQNNLTMYNMQTLPQRIQINPALISDSRFYFSMPGFSSIHVLYGNNGFKLKELMSVDQDNNLVIHPKKFYNALNKNNRISMDGHFELFNVGFKARKSFITLSLSENVKSGFSYPKDFIGLFVIGNAGENLGKDLNFNFGFDVMAYNDVSATYSRMFLKDKLRLGIKGSYLNGIFNFNTERSDLIFNTNAQDFHYTIRSDIKINTASIIDTLNENFNADNIAFNVLKSRNRGMSLGLGGTYQLKPRIVLSASIINLGFINWKENVMTYQSEKPNSPVEFKGMKVGDFFTENGNMDSSVRALLDTLKDKFKMKYTYGSYKTNLPSTFYLGGNFWLTKRHNFGLLFYGNYFQKKLNPAFTLSYNGKITRIVGLSVSYSMINRSFVNGGVGLTLNGSAFQYHFVADNLLGIIKYRNANTVDFRMGINFTFLRKDKQPGLKGPSKKLG